MKRPVIPDSQLSNHTFGYAPRDMECDGCHEIPIPEGNTMMTATQPGVEGERHYCIRCIFAMQVKMMHNGGMAVQVSPGSLRLERLSSAFRKRWIAMCEELDIYKSQGQYELCDDAIRRFADDMGLRLGDNLLETTESKNKREAEAAEKAAKAKRHEQYIRRKENRMKKEQDEIRRLTADLSALKQTVAGKATELARHFLAAKVAHIRGEKAKYDEAHGASAAILVELQRLAEVTA